MPQEFRMCIQSGSLKAQWSLPPLPANLSQTKLSFTLELEFSWSKDWWISLLVVWIRRNCWYPGRASLPALPAPVSHEPAVETRCFAQIVHCNYLDYLLFTLVETLVHAEHGACTSVLPALAKPHRVKIERLKRKLFQHSGSAAPETLGIWEQGCA